jgi:hypothetical protein
VGAGGITNALAPDDGTGVNAWQTLTPTTSPTAFAAYVHDWSAGESNTLVQLGWALHARLRVTTTNDAADGGMQVEFAVAGKGYAIDFGSDASGNPVVGLAPPTGNEFTLPTSTSTLSGLGGQYVTYSLIDTNHSGTFRLFANGADTGLSTTGFSTTESRVYFGDGTGTSAQNGGANWNLVLVEVPEPSMMALGTIGLLALAHKWRQMCAYRK